MLTNYILIQLNGQPFNCFANLYLKDLLIYLGFDLSSIIIEYNNEIIQSNVLGKIKVTSGDRVEVLTMVGGG